MHKYSRGFLPSIRTEIESDDFLRCGSNVCFVWQRNVVREPELDGGGVPPSDSCNCNLGLLFRSLVSKHNQTEPSISQIMVDHMRVTEDGLDSELLREVAVVVVREPRQISRIGEHEGACRVFAPTKLINPCSHLRLNLRERIC